jgi:uncharacterized protein
MISSRLLLTEGPRGLRQEFGRTVSEQELAALLGNADRLLRTMVLRPIDPRILREAGDLPDPLLRSLDAIHVATALRLRPLIDAFVTYDKRQGAVAREAGLRVVSPGTA